MKEDGTCINFYETIDVVELVRQDAYSQLDLTIAQALQRRNKDFAGVVKCTPEDTLANVLSYVRERRVHRMVILDRKDRLVGVLTLSDILRYLSHSYDLDPVQLLGCACWLFFFCTGPNTEPCWCSGHGTGGRDGERLGGTYAVSWPYTSIPRAA